MTEHISTYIKEINQLYQTGLTTEHSFRPALQRLLQDCTGCIVINEQSHIDCGAPDLTLLSKQQPIAYIEAKDLEDGDLDGRKKNKKQFERYKASLDTIVFTDYLDFHLYEHGEWQQSIRLAEIQGNKIRLSDTDRFVSLMEHIKNARPQRITSASKLTQLMAGKARLLRDIIEQALIQDGDNPTELRRYMEAFRQVLIHDITPKTFADIYAQTIVYGMFAARLHDKTPEDFSRDEANKLIPKSNYLLRRLFNDIAGYNVDSRISWILDDLVAAFRVTDMERVMKDFKRGTQQTDPLMHFYEDFLGEYDSKLKKIRGVYYTPQPVVDFIVRAVDDILRTEFNLPMGLADTSKVEVKQAIPQDLKHRKEKVIKHRVQVLDPATGTGTFLAETVRQIKRNLGGQMGAWDSYVPEHLLPRLHGFELMMAPYTIAHLKLDMEIGIPAQQRLNVYLTNSLEEAPADAGTLFGNYLAQEANEASHIKKSAPVLIVMGNPPYSVSSSNKGKWISRLLDDYKKNLNEKKLNLDDDYIKFIRLAQYYVERNSEGVLAYISNNSFIDGITHRQMRSELMRVFDKIYILDLHGNSRKKETCPDGSKDENVFDIQQGVSINIFVKTKAKSKKLAEVYHYDLYGIRENKYTFLYEHSLANVKWEQLNPQTPSFFFVPKDFSLQKEYEKGFKVNELMGVNNSGIQTDRDTLFTDITASSLAQKMNLLFSSRYEQSFIEKYNVKDSSSYKLLSKIKTARYNAEDIHSYLYRPFDSSYIFYNKDIISRPAFGVMQHLLKPNTALITTKLNRQLSLGYCFVTDKIVDRHILDSAADATYIFPLYLYPKEGSFETDRRPNLDAAIREVINAAIGKEASPEDIFDYIYGVLHSPAYREKYKEFLKVDFPRIPYPKNADEFEHFRHYGNQLRELHLMHKVPVSTVEFPESGSMMVEQLSYAGDKVRINGSQYFANVPAEAWNFYIGGYQPAQKWLKDRKGRTLSFDEIEHYRKIIAVLLRTAELMRKLPTL